ncbi:MAG: 50S ribosomal protein L20 [Erysipelotrichaceae bacterium]|nr:50S ribosomal protein L20 [Erysipelotrichaceae bacterium]MBR3693302.1 50S ribosomal protein L20 [Erysipelotrichales bacterium]
MPRVKGGTVSRNRRKKVLKLAKGYFGSKHRLYRTAHEQVMRSLRYAYRDRKQLKREMRKLWIARINAAARMNDISYSKLMYGMKLANININRKMLSEMAIHDAKGFSDVVAKSKKAIEEAGK